MHRGKVAAARPLLINSSSSFRDAIANVTAMNVTEKATVAQLNDSKVTTRSPRSSDIHVFPSLRLCMLPDINGKNRTDLRPIVSGLAKSVIAPLLMGHTSKVPSRRIIVQGNVYGNYLRRIQRELDAHIIVVEKETERILQHIEGCKFSDDEKALDNFSFIRGSLLYCLQQFAQQESIDNIIMASPKPFPAVPQSVARTIHRDFFIISHKALKVRAHEQDDKGIVTWTNNKPMWAFIHEQMDEAKLVASFAKKKPSVFQSVLPTEHDVPYQLDQLQMFAASKKEATPTAAFPLIDDYAFGRQYFRALFDSPPPMSSGATPPNRDTKRRVDRRGDSNQHTNNSNKGGW